MDSNNLARRSLFASAALLATGAVTAGFGSLTPPSTPIMQAALRVAVLDKLGNQFLADDCDDEADDAHREAISLGEDIVNMPPQSLADAAILLMKAATDIKSDALGEDGTYDREHSDIIVRRVMHFLASAAGIDLLAYGGGFWLPHQENEALTGTVTEAVLRFNRLTDETARERIAEENEYRQIMVFRWRRHQRGEELLAERIAEHGGRA